MAGSNKKAKPAVSTSNRISAISTTVSNNIKPIKMPPVSEMNENNQASACNIQSSYNVSSRDGSKKKRTRDHSTDLG